MTTATFSVRNYEQFQHYKDRNPVWIKLYNSLLEDYEFGLLPDASKAHLIAIYLLASRYKNKIPMDGNWVARKISATTAVDLTLLEKSGFIQFNQECSNTLATCYQPAIPEKRREEGETEKKREELAASQAKPKQQKVKSRTRLPEEFPLQRDLDWAHEKWLGKGRVDLCESLADEVAKFRDHHTANATASADWSASWRTWATNAMNFTKRARYGNGKPDKSAHDKFFAAGESLVRELLGEAGDGDDRHAADAAGYELLPPRLHGGPS